MTQAAIKKATVQDLLARPEGRFELIAGEIVPREAARFEHSDAQAGIATLTRSAFQRKPGGPAGGWWIATEAEVAYTDSDCYVHDLAGWRRDRVPEKPSGRPVSTSPDWVCEILSPGNWRNDTVVKFEACFRAKVGHYWIVDLDHRVLTVYRWHPEGWLRLAAVEPGQRVRIEPFEAVELDVGGLFGGDVGGEAEG